MRIMILVLIVSILSGCNVDKTKENNFEGTFTNMITGYGLNCETVIQELIIKNNSFQYKRFCQSEPSKIFESANGNMRKISDLSFLLLNKDSTKQYNMRILTDSLISFIIKRGQKDEFVTELSRKVDTP